MVFGWRFLGIIICVVLAGCQQTRQTGSVQHAAPQSSAASKGPDSNCIATINDLFSEHSGKSSAGESGWAQYNWQRVWQKCPDSAVAAHNAIVSLMGEGEYDKAMKVAASVAGTFPDFLPLNALAMRLNEPVKLASRLADEKYANWLNAKSRYSFNLTPPQKDSPSPLPKLIKGEFEKRADFEARVNAAKAARKRELQSIEDRYAEAVSIFNREVEKYNKLVQQEKEERLAKRNEKRERFLNEALAQVLGPLELLDLVYDSEQERFSARLRATTAGLDERVAVRVPLAGGQAQDFKEHRAKLKPELRYTINDAGTAVQRPTVVHRGKVYPLEFTSEINSAAEITAVASVQLDTIPEIETIKQARDSIKIDEAYYTEALSIQDDPALAALRQQQAENENTLRLARAEQARERERKRIEGAIRQQQQKLASLGGTTGGEYEGLVEKYSWSFNRAADPATDMVAVIIGNRNYGRDIPKVHYAYNDARAMQAFLENGLGVPRKIMGTNPSRFKHGERFPVEMVSWDDTQDYIKKLNAKSGKKYRLPTEAEWEYAARSGGKRQKFAGGNQVEEVAWYASNSSSTHKVGAKAPNGLGIFDMSGNVWEWTGDWYGKDYYSSSPTDNPQGPGSGSHRVFRGGCWNNWPAHVRSADRAGRRPWVRYSGVGFRLVLAPGQR